ncbi:class I SAM-dependent methyltransferase [Roseobacter sinensis]|uniref:Class I SAM-dependent methyltransferase n=1 Tax=Roseobacter sinensis TaxID=2931391 RepID=A0ABT3BLH5_9RHOB|nr:class I SAM-dependent methyltransferase [Roseobacter sp. WL0113]MCV3274415.1 class I SAM-dependent methyltransferase [Roseobacter sp. WL0113]
MSNPEKFWDQSADNYDKSEEQFEYIHSRSRDLAKEHLTDSDVVLDYGCGTGTTACYIAGHVKEIQGIDISARMVEIAAGKAAKAKIANVDFAQSDIFDDQFEEGSFDVILAFNMLHTVPDPQMVVQRTLELLKPDGTFLSATPCLGGKMSFFVRLKILLVRLLLVTGVIPVPIRRLRTADLDDLVAVEGLRTVRTEVIYRGATSYFVVAKKD